MIRYDKYNIIYDKTKTIILSIIIGLLIMIKSYVILNTKKKSKKKRVVVI